MTFDEALNACGIIAILRGVRPHEVVPLTERLFRAGIRIVEVPLNSPDPLISIGLLSSEFAGRMVIGAGTVLSVSEVDKVRASGGTLIVAPNIDTDVVSHAVVSGLEPLPGVYSATEAFAAIRAGARHLKLFPADAVSPKVASAWRAVLPSDAKIHAVGGITPDNIANWVAHGVNGFGVGGSLYRPGMTPDEVSSRASEFVETWVRAQSAVKRQ